MSSSSTTEVYENEDISSNQQRPNHLSGRGTQPSGRHASDTHVGNRLCASTQNTHTEHRRRVSAHSSLKPRAASSSSILSSSNSNRPNIGNSALSASNIPDKSSLQRSLDVKKSRVSAAQATSPDQSRVGSDQCHPALSAYRRASMGDDSGDDAAEFHLQKRRRINQSPKTSKGALIYDLVRTSSVDQRSSNLSLPPPEAGSGTKSLHEPCNRQRSDSGSDSISDADVSWREALEDSNEDQEVLPRFKPKYEELKSVAEVTHDVFDLMRKPLSQSKGLDDGRIYILRIVGRPGYVKIGRTTKPLSQRKGQIRACTGGEVEAPNDDDHEVLSNHTLVESLIHKELQNYRRYFSCDCKSKTKVCHDVKDTLTKHGEWFEIAEEKAFEVIRRWRKWMSTAPYCNGVLRPEEQLRIDLYRKNAYRMNNMKTADGKDWHWDRFMNYSQLHLRILAYGAWLFGERLERSTRSRYDSLCKHWQSNLLLYAPFIALSLINCFASDALILSVTFRLWLVIFNAVILGSTAIFYAA